MRNIAIIMITVIMMTGVSSWGAPQQDEYDFTGRWYAGGALSYNKPMIKDEWVTIKTDQGTKTIDPDSSWGLNLKSGYNIFDYLAVEGLFQYFHKFEASESYNANAGLGFGGADLEGTAKVKGWALTINAKGTYPMGKIRPYGVIGLGFGRFTTSLEGSANTQFGSFSASTTPTQDQKYNGAFGRIGAGCDYYFTPNIGLEGEVSYNAGFGNIAPARIISGNVGVVYAF